MSWFRFTYIRQHKPKAVAYVILLVLTVAAIIYFRNVLLIFFSSPESVRDWVFQYGPFAPVALLLLQIVQVVVAPLSNFFINFAGGYIFGPWEGFLYNYVGWIIGAILVFFFSRHIGRSIVQFFIPETRLADFDMLMARGKYILFILFLLPGPPDDFLVYCLGISGSISFRTFLWMIVIGKIPGKITTSFLGAGVAEHSFISVGVFVVFIIGAVIVFWRRPELWRIWEHDKLKTYVEEEDKKIIIHKESD